MSSQPVQDKAERDQLIEEASEQWPEYSELDKEQERIYAEAHERGPNMSYPEFEGPGYTEPAVNDPMWHEDHSEHERDHYWEGDGNPSDERDPDAARYEHAPLDAHEMAAREDPPSYVFSEQEKAGIAGGILGEYLGTWEPAERAEAVEAIRQDYEAGS